MTSLKFPPENRIRSRADFSALYKNHVHAADDTLVMLAAKNDVGRTRLGLAVSRKVGNAVVRNYWKRRLREAFRHVHAELPVGLDFVLRPRKGAVCDYHAMVDSIPQLAKRVNRKLQRES